MKKGIAPLIPIIVILALLLTAEYFIVSYLIRSEYIVARFLSESIVLSKADKVETYVRSFQSAVELSLLQACYNIKDHSSELWQDYDVSYVPKENDFKEMIVSNATYNLTEYLQDYVDFIANPDNNAEEIEIPDPTISGGNVNEFEDNYISIVFNKEVHFEVPEEIDNAFNPTASIKTKLKEVWDQTNDLIDNNDIGKKIHPEVKDDECTVADTLNDKVDQALTNFENEFDEDIKIDLERIGSVSNLQKIADCCQVTATVKVTMNDTSRKYPVYNKEMNGVSEEYLGLIYRVRTGNADVCSPTATTTTTTTTTSSSTTTTIEGLTCESRGGICIPKGICDIEPDLRCVASSDCTAPQCCCVVI